MQSHHAKKKPPSSSIYGVVLAARADTRLAPFIRKLRGDDLPKPFVSFIGKRFQQVIYPSDLLRGPLPMQSHPAKKKPHSSSIYGVVLAARADTRLAST